MIDKTKPGAIILGDLYKEFNWERLNEDSKSCLKMIF